MGEKARLRLEELDVGVETMVHRHEDLYERVVARAR
jgi:hypothetical protein